MGFDDIMNMPIDDYITESQELSSGIFWVITDNSNMSDYKLIFFDVSCDPSGNPSGGHKIALNAKSGLTYNHKVSWEENIRNNPSHRPYNKKAYNYYPRGRVEISHNRAIIYLNPNINKSSIVSEIKDKFGLNTHNISEVRISVDGSTHYQCFIDWNL